jgi:hypothetical protein
MIGGSAESPTVGVTPSILHVVLIAGQTRPARNRMASRNIGDPLVAGRRWSGSH